MTRNSLVFLFIFLLNTVNAFSGITKIYGIVENAEGYTIRLKSYTDYISFNDTILAEAYLDKTGSFYFDLNIEYPLRVILKLGFQISTFYIEPNQTYKLKIHYIKENENILFTTRYPLVFEFIDLPKNDLNFLIENFNSFMDQFLIKNFDRIYKKKQLNLIDSLEVKIRDLISPNNQYFNDFIEYRLADIISSAKKQDDKMLFLQYFKNKPLQYNHYEYMFFFNTFFHNYIKTKILTSFSDDLFTMISDQKKFDSLLDVLKKDDILVDERLRELVVLKNLYDFFYDSDFNSKKIIQHIENITKNSNYAEHKQIGKNLVDKIVALQPGSPLPDFAFQDLEDKKLNKTDFEKKYTLLNFWELDCSDCFINIDSLEYLQKTYSDKLNVVCVSSYKFVSKLKTIIDKQNYSMFFLLASPDNKAYDDLKIKSLPTSILIDERGNIVLYPAILPQIGFQNTFKPIFE